MAHEISHILLHSVRHPKKDNEFYTDLTAIMLGFQNIFQNGRRITKTDVEQGFMSTTTRTQTTTYGYLNDKQFYFVRNKINSILENNRKRKKLLSEGLKKFTRLLSKYEKTLFKSKAFLEYLTKNTNKRISGEDGKKIMIFFQPGYMDDLASSLKEYKEKQKTINNFLKGLFHYTDQTVNLLSIFTNNLKIYIGELTAKLVPLKRDTRMLKKYVGYGYRIKFFSLRLKITKKYLDQLGNKLKKLKWNNFKKYILILALLPLFLLIIFISIKKQSNNTYIIHIPAPVSVIPSNENSSVELNDTSTIQTKDSKTYVSLPNGTVLSKSSYYLKGLGQLKIDNGTNLDAIAKLVNASTNKSIFTVYIKAKNTYSISKISDGNFKLFFNLGNDWDTEIKAFMVNSGYKVFEENFDFTTSEYEEGDYVHTQYATFSVTLNPVIGGQAKTDEINAIEFSNY